MFVSDSFNADEFWNNRGLLVFPHVPKTGGTTIRSVLKTSLKDEVFVHDETEPVYAAVRKLGSAALNRLKLIIGHMPFGLHALFPDRPVKYVSVVRHPIDQIASDYMHRYRHNIFEKSGELLLKTNGVVEFVQALGTTYGDDQTIIAKNNQCWNLFPDLFRDLCPDLSQINMIRKEILRRGVGTSLDHDDVRRKLDGLAKKWYVTIGVQENLWEFVSYLLALFGKEAPREVQENVGFRARGRDIISAPERATLLEWNKIDRILHGFVQGKEASPDCGIPPTEFERMKLIADIRLKALTNCRPAFIHFRDHYLRAQQTTRPLTAPKVGSSG